MHLAKFSQRALTAAVGCALAAAAAAPVLAETTGIQEVVVTAQKRQETLQETPIAMSAMTAETLEKMGVTDFSGVLAASPSVYFARYPSASGALFLFMRAQGNGDPAQITSDGAVGLYQDGIYIARPQAATFDLADVERVEVLRGPQGTLYGRNTTGGAVNVISKKPTGEFGFKQDLNFGSRNLFRSLTSVDLPSWNNVSTRFTLLKSSIDGLVKNAGSGQDYGEDAQLAGRFALRWAPSENFVADYSYETGKQESTPAYYRNKGVVGVIPGYSVDTGDHTWRAIDLPLSKARFEGHGLTLSWDVSDTLTIRSLTGYRDLTSHFYQDYAEVFFGPLQTDDLIESDQFSQELQFVGSALDEHIKYAAGLYYFKESGSHVARNIVGPDVYDRFVDADSKSQAVYAQVTWTPPVLDDHLDLTVGGRYTKDERNASRTQQANGFTYEDDITNDQSFKRFNPAFTINYRWTDDLSTYAKATTGYRAGGSSESGQNFAVTFGPEKVKSYELGLKSYWWDRRVRLNVAQFWTDYTDIQILTSPDATNATITQTINAGSADISGFELDLLIEPIDDLQISLDYTYLDPDLKKVNVDGVDLTLQYNIPFAPQNTYNIGVDYTFLRFNGGDLSARVDYRRVDSALLSGTSGTAVSGGDAYERPAYSLLDARLTMAFDLPRGDRARVALWGKNLQDRNYKSHVIGLGDRINGYSSQAYTLGERASYGINVVYEY